MKLTIELVPKTAFFKNVRSEVSKKDWDILRRKAYRKYDYCCAICGGKGNNHPVECHEIWEYNDSKHIQRLKDLVALCPSCHQVKHIGLSGMRGLGEDCIKHMMKINKSSREEAEQDISDAFHTWNDRSKHTWKCDISLLAERLK